MKVVKANVTINAPISKVWNNLTDINNYKSWNPFVIAVEANKEIPIKGTKMKFSVRFSDGKESKSNELVTAFTPPENNDNKSAEWEYDFDSFLSKIGMIKATRVQRLVQLENGSTSYFSEEKFTGWGIGAVPIEKVQQGFVDQANALKTMCEG